MAEAGARTEVRDRLCSDPVARDAAEFFERFPQEASTVLQRSVELSAVLSCLLGAHCLVLACQASGPGAPDLDGIDVDALLRCLCLARVICMVARPYWWMNQRQQFKEARALATPQEVARRLQEIQSCPRSAVEEALRTTYYVWLVGFTAAVCVARLVPEPTALTQHAWRHLLLNFTSMAVHRIGCMMLFFLLSCSDMQRGVKAGALDAHTTRLEFPTDACSTAQLGAKGPEEECSICLCEYAAGEEIRKLGCGHCFHSCCLDPWLLNHRNRCPLCLDIVGLPQ